MAGDCGPGKRGESPIDSDRLLVGHGKACRENLYQ